MILKSCFQILKNVRSCQDYSVFVVFIVRAPALSLGSSLTDQYVTLDWNGRKFLESMFYERYHHEFYQDAMPPRRAVSSRYMYVFRMSCSHVPRGFYPGVGTICITLTNTLITLITEFKLCTCIASGILIVEKKSLKRIREKCETVAPSSYTKKLQNPLQCSFTILITSDGEWSRKLLMIKSVYTILLLIIIIISFHSYRVDSPFSTKLIFKGVHIQIKFA